MKRRRIAVIGAITAFSLLGAALIAQDEAQVRSAAGMNELYAMELFRTGLEAYNRYFFKDAVLSFEQALSYRPGEAVILDYLGKAYYRSGLEEIALREWEAAVQAYGPEAPETLLVNNRIEVVRNRRSLFPEMNDDLRFVEVGRFPGRTGNISSFSQPSAVLEADDGSSWVVAYGSNDIVRVDVNGIVREWLRGPPLAGFDRPYDIARGLDGKLYVSEFRGGRVSVLSKDGVWEAYIGSKGIHDGNLLGPANLTVDDEGYIYVVDYGNRRISKFSPDGEFIVNFGKKSYNFDGFISPTGIASLNGLIYAADGIAGVINIFDKIGLYVGNLLDEGLTSPESLRAYGEGNLIVADTKRLLIVDTQTSIVRQLTESGNSRVRLIGASADTNGNILAADFSANEVTVLSSIDNVAGGLFVQIERVVTGQFPTINVEVSVHDRLRTPIVGLREGNFLITENGKPVDALTFMGSGNYSPSADIAVIFERSHETANLKADLQNAMRDITAALTEPDGSGGQSAGAAGNIAAVISAGNMAVLERFTAGNVNSLTAAAAAGEYTQAWRFDSALMLAANLLLPLSKKRAVVFVTAGGLGEAAYQEYNLSQMAAYLANNGILFYAVLAGEGGASEAVRYLCNQTGGEILRLYRRQGIGGAIRAIAEKPAGTYGFSYLSSLQTDFGRALLPVEVETYLLERSGRDAAGYFAPLE
ncbi:MAG: NHL repeat-containing protein [Spirochaetaceae bacterium]|jgi:DNA-binding beta-propeller fold protein YncE|nr:NHL repeat-containing protein [Spirochaetaceae bacterium]